jgi:hypothetical protein
MPDLECFNVGLCLYKGKFVFTYEVIGFSKLGMIPLDKKGVSYKLAVLLIKNL